jgi:hypothetical protein
MERPKGQGIKPKLRNKTTFPPGGANFIHLHSLWFLIKKSMAVKKYAQKDTTEQV